VYRTGDDYRALLEFVVTLRNVAPFNAMLLQLQKPGLRFAASALDWQERFGRTIKEAARPLLILWRFGPVATVYDVQDTEGRTLPEDANAFVARGDIDAALFDGFARKLAKRHIQLRDFDGGDSTAGSIRVIRPGDPKTKKKPRTYRMLINRNHPIPVRFVTLVHELGHLCLGHLGPDKTLSVPQRRHLNLAQRELEAESVAYIVAGRNGVVSKSQTYLATFVHQAKSMDDLDLYQIMRAAGQVETFLGLTSHTKFVPRPVKKPKNGLIDILALTDGANEEDDACLICHV
jgi:hypothetical protein